MVTETPTVCYWTSPKFCTPLVRLVRQKPIHKVRFKTRRQACLYTKYRSAATYVVEIVVYFICIYPPFRASSQSSQIAKFMGTTWGPPGSCRPQMGPCWPHWHCDRGYAYWNRCSPVCFRIPLRSQKGWTCHDLTQLRPISWPGTSGQLTQGLVGSATSWPNIFVCKPSSMVTLYIADTSIVAQHKSHIIHATLGSLGFLTSDWLNYLLFCTRRLLLVFFDGRHLV